MVQAPPPPPPAGPPIPPAGPPPPPALPIVNVQSRTSGCSAMDFVMFFDNVLL